jgi:hypothetical protein
MLFRARKQSSLLLAAIFLAVAGCSLEGLGDLPELPGAEGGEGGESADISGVIVDGYVEGAHVFLDLNGNQQRDEDEPSASSDAKGAFTLRVDNFDRERLREAFLQAEIPDSAKDSDDLGRTLREAGKKGFTLLSPASALLDDEPGVDAKPAATDAKSGETRNAIKAAVLSPLSTLVVSEMIERGVPLAEAKAAVQTALGLPDKELLRDFVAKPDAVLHNVARAAAVSLGEAARAKAGDADAGVPMMRPGLQVVEAVRSVKEQLPQVIDALGLRAETAPPASVDRVRSEFGEQVKRAEEARAALADAGVRLPDPMPGLMPAPLAGDGGVIDPMRMPPPVMPPKDAMGSTTSGADAGVRVLEPVKMPLPVDAGSAAPSTGEARPMQPPLVRPELPPGTNTSATPGDAGVRPVETKPADAGVRPDGAAYDQPLPNSYPMNTLPPVYPAYDAGGALRK